MLRPKPVSPLAVTRPVCLAGFVALLAAACGGEGTPKSDSPAGSQGGGARATAQSAHAGAGRAGGQSDTSRARSPGATGGEAGSPAGTRFPGRVADLPPWGRALEEAVPSERAELAEERIGARAQERLGAFLTALLERGDEGELAAFTVPQARFAPLFSTAEDPLFADGLFEVRAGEAGEADHGLADLAAQARAFVAGGRLGRLSVAVVEVAEPAGARPLVSAHAHAFCADGEGGRQWNARLLVEFERTGEELRLATVRVARSDVVSAGGRPFDEVTEYVFGQLPFYGEELLLGSDAYHLRTDRGVDFFYVGIQGIAVGDVDGDGLEDIYLSQLGGQPNRLLMHRPDGRVVDAAGPAGVAILDTTRGALFADLDHDGDLDLVVARGHNLLLCWNDGKGRFPEQQPLVSPAPSPIYSLSAADADGDGDLDLFACCYPHSAISGGFPAPYYDARNGAPNLFWRNEGHRSFREVSAEVGLDVNNRRLTYTSLWEDVDADGDLDLYVVNDFGPNNLYRNEGGRFSDVGPSSDAHDQAAGMGISSADVDLDGDMDLYVSNMFSPAGLRVMSSPRFMPDYPREVREAVRVYARGNSLLLNDGTGRFQNVAEQAGVAPGGWAWGAMFVDLQNDGLADLYVPNGFISNRRADDVESMFWRRVVSQTPTGEEVPEAYRRGWEIVGHLSQFMGYGWNGRERNYVYLNVGNARFVDVSALSRADFLDDARVCARLDWDGDGRLDLLLRNRTGPRLRLLRNVHPSPGHFLALRLVGTRSPTEGIGAQVIVELPDRTLRRTVHCGEGLLGQSSRDLHFGLGRDERVERVTIRWSSGTVDVLEHLASDRLYRVVEESGAAQVIPRPPSPLEAVAHRPVEAPRRRAGRVILADALPLARLQLPRFEGGVLPVGELVGAPAIVLVLDPASPVDLSLLRSLARQGPRFAETGLTLVRAWRGDPPPGSEPEALRGPRVRIGQRETRLLQALLVEVLGPFPDLPQPIGLLLDRGGNLVAVYTGRYGFGHLFLDAQAAARKAPDERDTLALTGGRWLGRPRRALADLAGVLELLGERDLAAWYRELDTRGR